MSESIEMTGWVAAKKEVRTLKDLRDLVAWADKYGVTDEAVIDYSGSGPYLYVDFIGDAEVAKATWIECGDHLWGDEQWDVLIETHRQPEYEAQDPAKYDRPTKDRFSAAHRTAADYCYDNGHSYADADDICYLCGAKS